MVGVLLWDDETSVVPHPVSPLVPTAAAGEPEPEPPAIAAPALAPDGLPGRGRSGTRILTFARITSPRPEPLPDQPDTVFVEGVGPAELLRRPGTIPATLRPRSRERARQAGASLWAAHRPMIRVGTAGGWVYATQEEGATQFTREEVLRLHSAIAGRAGRRARVAA